MTKKNWNIWKQRFGETVDIIVCNELGGHPHSILSNLDGDKIIKGTFQDDESVDLVIERHRNLINGHQHVENEYLTLQRENIKTIKYSRQ